MVSVRGEKGQRPLAMLAKQARKSGAGFPASGLSHDTGTLLLLVVVEMSRGRAREVGAAGGRGGLCAGGEGCRELARVLMFRTVDGGGVGRMHFLD